MNTLFWGIAWPTWSLVCLGLTVLYAIIWPKSKALHIEFRWQQLVLRWGHSLVWALLALQFALRGNNQRWVAPVANLVALLAAATYAIFMITLTTTARKP
ncbi:MAG: hypothetical protein JXB15_05220 [Anaerolineales bacterium]|nr:hypothetical protein [Anaerolineales bacterium]